MKDRRIYVNHIDVPNSTKLTKRISDYLDLFMEEFVCTTIYAVGCFVSATLLSDLPVVNAVIALVLYIMLLSSILVISLKDQRKGFISSYSTETKAFLFQIHLFLFSISMLVLGVVSESGEIVSIAITYLMLLVGFAISLTDLYSATSWDDFKERIKAGYTNIEVSKMEKIIFSATECAILVLSCMIPGYPWLVLPLFAIIPLITILDIIRKKRINAFLSWVEEFSENASIMILLIGEESVLYPKLLKKLNITNDENRENAEEKNKVEYLVVLNNSIKRSVYLTVMYDQLQRINAETVIIDPSINNKTKKKSRGFVWFSMPCKHLGGVSLEEYESIVRN